MKQKFLCRYEGYEEWSLKEPMYFKILRETPKGWWIENGWEARGRWVSKSGKKRFAYPTVEEAEVNYIARKKRQIQLNLGMIKAAEEGLRVMGANVPRPGNGYMRRSTVTLEDLI
jgi:hypothetical protein